MPVLAHRWLVPCALAVLALAVARPVLAERAHAARRPSWRRGQQTTATSERAHVGQELTHAVTAASLIDARTLVAGADPIRRLSGRVSGERYLVTREVAAALVELRAVVKRELGPEYDIWLNGAFDSSGRAHRGGSLHRTGRAVDLDLYRTRAGERRGEKVGRVGELAFLVNEVFTSQLAPDGRALRGWVLAERNHVHASLESPSLDAVPGVAMLAVDVELMAMVSP